MPNENEPQSRKKHRVIHWNPEAGKEQKGHRWSIGRIVGWSAGGLVGLLAVAAITTRTIKFFNPDAFAAFSDTPQQVVAQDPNTLFINQSLADTAHDQAAKTLEQIKKLPTDHPQQQADLILIQKTFDAATAILRAQKYAEAYGQFQQVMKQMDDFSQSVRAKQEVTTGLDTLFVRAQELEKVKDLNPDLLNRSLTEYAQARQFSQNGSYLAASQALRNGNDALDQLQQLLANTITGNLQRGAQALMNGEKEAAASAFRAVLERDPGNEAAVGGLKRSETIDRVYALLIQGQDLEKDGRYAEAAQAYGRAFDLDSLSTAAQQGQARATRLDQEARFDTAFSAAQDAFRRRDWEAVMSQGQAALQIEPGNADVQEMLVNARDEAHKDNVARLLARADSSERIFQWADARAAYLEVLDLEPGNDDAVAGVVRSGEMIRALDAYAKYVDRAEELASQGEFQLAISVWNDAVASKPNYLSFDDRTTKLQAYLIEQNKPVTVTFVSDGDTTVTVIGVASFGSSKFKNRTFDIYPGNYEVVGNRRNYRDVHIQLQVRQGTNPPVVNVVCSVPART